MDIKAKLDSMVTKTFIYQESLVKVLGHTFDGSDIIISTDVGKIRLPFNEADELIGKFRALTPATTSAPSAKREITMVSFDSETLGSLRNTLMDNIKKLKEDKTYVDQAKVINDGIGQIINLAKTEIEMLKTIHGLNRGI